MVMSKCAAVVSMMDVFNYETGDCAPVRFRFFNILARTYKMRVAEIARVA